MPTLGPKHIGQCAWGWSNVGHEVTTVFTLVQWNAIIDKINIGLANCQNPGASGPSLPHVTAPHVWTLKDVTNAQNALKGSCSPAPTFITPVAPYVWMQKILDELTNAAKACCSGPTGSDRADGTETRILVCRVVRLLRRLDLDGYLLRGVRALHRHRARCRQQRSLQDCWPPSRVVYRTVSQCPGFGYGVGSQRQRWRILFGQ